MILKSTTALPRIPEGPVRAPCRDAPIQGDPDRVELSRQPPTPVEWVDVSHSRELRGAWVATVWNINFPSHPSAGPASQKKEMIAQLERMKEAGLNAVFFQVRPEGDALYRSKLEPWSSCLTGVQGKDPGYDPLETLITEAHQRNLEVHAWLNPFRAQAASSTQVAPHIAVEHPEHVHKVGSGKWMDPGAKVVRERLVDVCTDITKRYDIDGLHFDDYFYPYPDGSEFPDDSTWKAYQAGGGKLSRADWRRDNVNTTIREVSAAVSKEKDHVRFGVSPFGIPAPDKPAGITGLNQYESLYADPQKWMDEGWVDYLAPQLYWPSTQPAQAYGTLLDWWTGHSSGGRYIFGGNNLDDLGSKPKWSVQEYRTELALSRKQADKSCKGNIWWNVGPLLENRKGIRDTFSTEFYRQPALTPPLASAIGKTVVPPQVATLGEGLVSLCHNDEAPLRAWTVYHQQGETWTLDRIVAGSENQVHLASGKWAIAAATMHGQESLGVVVNV